MALAYNNPNDDGALTDLGVVQNFEVSLNGSQVVAKDGNGPYDTDTSKDPETMSCTLYMDDGATLPAIGDTLEVESKTFEVTSVKYSNGVDEWDGLDIEGARQYVAGAAQ